MTSVVVADDAPLLRTAVAEVLATAGMRVVGQAATVEALHLEVDRLMPDLAVIDVRFPPHFRAEGLDAAFAIRARHPSVGLLIVTHHVERALARKLLNEAGPGVGYLLKDRAASIESFVEAARTVVAGGVAFDPEVVETILGAPESEVRIGRLTVREREVLGLIAEGLSNQAIAERLYLSDKTIEAHVSRILRQLDLPEDPATNRRVLAVRRFLGSASA